VRLPLAIAFGAGAAWCAPAPAAHIPSLAAGLGIARRLDLEGAVALTFDDGPHAQGTPAVLEVLAARRATATFFLVGEQVRRNPGLAGEIVAAGHAVAVHGDRHRNLLRLTPRQADDDLARAAHALGEAARPVHRPPYGIYSTAALALVRRRGWRPLLWSRWGRDWAASATPEAIAARVAGVGSPGPRLHAGDVLLLHDADNYSAPGSWRRTVAALPRVLDEIESQGLRTAPVPG
jgi:peptidoglycan/xylan/chitin deacetylase (PgdA/CDA1 family)